MAFPQKFTVSGRNLLHRSCLWPARNRELVAIPTSLAGRGRAP